MCFGITTLGDAPRIGVRRSLLRYKQVLIVPVQIPIYAGVENPLVFHSQRRFPHFMSGVEALRSGEVYHGYHRFSKQQRYNLSR